MKIKFETLAPNSNRVTVGNVTILFSYETAVAFTMPLMNWVVDPTKYSRTTSRHHINQSIPKEWQAKANSRQHFEEALEKALSGYSARDVIFFALGDDYPAPRPEDAEGWAPKSRGSKLLQSVAAGKPAIVARD